jgi:hypothetical protein
VYKEKHGGVRANGQIERRRRNGEGQGEWKVGVRVEINGIEIQGKEIICYVEMIHADR